MKTLISLNDLESIIEKKLELTTTITRSEIKAFVSGILSGIGIAVVNKRRNDPVRTAIGVLTGYDEIFDFHEMRRTDLVVHLRNCSGLSTSFCKDALKAIEGVIEERLNQGDEVEIERLGIYKMAPQEGGCRDVIKLFLSLELALR